jgi:uncharacterized protein YqjF (DUF2071 family)
MGGAPSPTVPLGRFAMRQAWCDVLFLHHAMEPAALAAHLDLPPGLELSCFGGTAWLGVVPFRMEGVKLMGWMALPTAHAFPELNVRTYVHPVGVPEAGGVWFASLDATSRLAVWGGRRGFGLPYHHARMHIDKRDGWTHYRCRRARDPALVFEGRYRPHGTPAPAAPGSLEAWLVERYRLYARDRRGGLVRAEVQHPPWPLQPVELDITTCTLAAPFGVPSATTFDHATFARRVDVRVGPPVPSAPGT